LWSIMFRQLAVIFLLIAFSVQVFNRTVIVLDYYTNTASFARNCENKAKPIMHCKGKCQMMKKLKEEEKKEQQVPERMAVKNDVVSSKSFFTTGTIVDFVYTRSYLTYYSPFFPEGATTSIFHPPGLI
jgi:hypothetical protein